jgi:hypothetical protein
MHRKRTLSKRHIKPRKNRGKSHRKIRSRKSSGGGCGCNSTSPISKFFVGGSTGATTNSLLALPANNYYPLNDYSKDPNYLVVSSGQTGNFVRSSGGGKSRRNKRGRKRDHKTRATKGGGYITAAADSLKPVVSATVVGANSYGVGGMSLSPPPYSMYTNTTNPPSA